MNYGKQPYGKNGDTTGGRKIMWFNQHVIVPFSRFIRGKALDVGCGNGRLNKIINGHIDTILCIDPIESFNEKFKTSKSTFEQWDLMDVVDEKFDTILFMGSWYIINRNWNQDDIAEKLNNILTTGGNIIAMFDIKQNSETDWEIYKKYFKVEKRITTDGTSMVARLYR